MCLEHYSHIFFFSIYIVLINKVVEQLFYILLLHLGIKSTTFCEVLCSFVLYSGVLSNIFTN